MRFIKLIPLTWNNGYWNLVLLLSYTINKDIKWKVSFYFLRWPYPAMFKRSFYRENGSNFS